MPDKIKLIRIATVPISLNILLKGQLKFMNEQGIEVLAVSAEGTEITEIVAREMVKHFVVPLTRTLNPLQDLRALGELVRLFRKERPDIVHTHTPKAGLLGMIASWICRVPVRMHTVAGLPLMEAKGMKRWILVVTEKITYALAHRIYPNSEGLKTFLILNLGFDQVKIKIIGKGSSNGIDANFFRRTTPLEERAQGLRSRYGVSFGDIVFSYVGRIVSNKGIGELIIAFKKFKAQQTNRKVFLFLVGHFEDELDPLKAEERAYLNNDKAVVLAGFQSDVRPWLMATDVFVFPSHREGFPNVVMQAAALEVPSIVSDITGSNEIIQNEFSGIVVPAKDPEKLHDSMVKLADETMLRRKYARNAFQFVTANFKQEVIWHQLLEEYKNLLAKTSTKKSPYVPN